MDNKELIFRLSALAILCIIAISTGTVAFSDNGSDNVPGYAVPDDGMLEDLGALGGSISLNDGSVVTVDVSKTIFHKEWSDGSIVSQKPCGVTYTSLAVQNDMLVLEKHDKYSEEYKQNYPLSYYDKVYDIKIIPLENIVSYQLNGRII